MSSLDNAEVEQEIQSHGNVLVHAARLCQGTLEKFLTDQMKSGRRGWLDVRNGVAESGNAVQLLLTFEYKPYHARITKGTFRVPMDALALATINRAQDQAAKAVEQQINPPPVESRPEGVVDLAEERKKREEAVKADPAKGKQEIRAMFQQRLQEFKQLDAKLSETFQRSVSLGVPMDAGPAVTLSEAMQDVGSALEMFVTEPGPFAS